MYIYGLFSPDGELRYIGHTTQSLRTRLNKHLCQSTLRRKNHRTDWIKSLEGKPYIQIIQSLNTIEDLGEAEIYWIKFFREAGCRLVNSDLGGVGSGKRSEETKKKIGEFQKGRPKPSLRGVPRPEYVREAARSANLGKRMSEETKLKISRSKTGSKYNMKENYNG